MHRAGQHVCIKQSLICSSRQKHLVSKRLASQSPAALAEILGVSVASLTASPTPSEPSTPVPELTPSGDPARTAEETVSTSTLSVADYFRQKLREKALARHAASGASSELPENSLARVKEEVKVAVGGVSWEGSRVQFGDVDEKPDEKPDVKPTILELDTITETRPTTLEVDVKPTSQELQAGDVKPSKEERRAARAEKRRLKEEKRARKAARNDAAPVDSESVDPPVPTKSEKRKREIHENEPSIKREKSS